MLWLSRTTCTPKASPEEGSAPVVVRFALRWVPSLEKQENCDKILRLFTKQNTCGRSEAASTETSSNEA